MLFSSGPGKPPQHAEAKRWAAVRVEVLDLTARGGIDTYWTTRYTTEPSARHAIGQAIGRDPESFALDTEWWKLGGRGHPLIWLVASWAFRVREQDWNKNDENREIVTQGAADALGWDRARFRLSGAHRGRGQKKPWIES